MPAKDVSDPDYRPEDSSQNEPVVAEEITPAERKLVNDFLKKYGLNKEGEKISEKIDKKGNEKTEKNN